MAAALAVLFGGGTLFLLLQLRRLGTVLDGEDTRPPYQARPSTCPTGCTCRGRVAIGTEQ